MNSPYMGFLSRNSPNFGLCDDIVAAMKSDRAATGVARKLGLDEDGCAMHDHVVLPAWPKLREHVEVGRCEGCSTQDSHILNDFSHIKIFFLHCKNKYLILSWAYKNRQA